MKPTSLKWVLKTVAVAHLCCYMSGEKRGRWLDLGNDMKYNEGWVITSMKTQVLQLSCWLAGWRGANLCKKFRTSISNVGFYGERGGETEQWTTFHLYKLFLNPNAFSVIHQGLFFLNHLMLRCVRSLGLDGFSFKMSVSVWRFCNHPFCIIFFLNDRSQKKLSRLHVTYEGTIESNGQGMLQVSIYK